MQETIIEPLSGWPHARAIPTEDGLPAYAITFGVLTPLRARMLDGCVDAAPVLLPALWLELREMLQDIDLQEDEADGAPTLLV